MKITKYTKLSECSSFITHDVLSEIEKKVSDSYLEGFESIVNSTVGEFIMLLRGDEEYLKKYFLKNNKDITVYEYAAKSKHLKKEIESISKFLKSLTLKQTDEEEAATRGVLFPTFEENILIYCQQKFFLNSFKEAENILLCDFLLHKKNDTANLKFEKNLRMLHDRKMKFKK
jgi:hypothetical protein